MAATTTRPADAELVKLLRLALNFAREQERYDLEGSLRDAADALEAASACSCITGPEWSGSPNPDKPDTEWVCDSCGRIIQAVEAFDAKVVRAADAITAKARTLYGVATHFAYGTDADILARVALRAAGVEG